MVKNSSVSEISVSCPSLMNGILHPIPSIKAPTRLIAALYQVLSAANYLACATSACRKGGKIWNPVHRYKQCHVSRQRRQLPLVLTGDNDAAISTGRQRLRRQRGNHQWQPWSRSTATAITPAPSISNEDDHSKLQLARRSDDDV